MAGLSPASGLLSNQELGSVRRPGRLQKELTIMNIGYIGLGNMGGALARRLQLRHPLVVHDQNEAAVQRMVERGASPGGSLGDLAARCDIIFLYLPTSDHVRAVIFGANGLAGAAKPGTLIVDQTTGDPAATRAMAAELAACGRAIACSIFLAVNCQPNSHLISELIWLCFLRRAAWKCR
ncbi:NAD(P)-dependent oxidoreductase [Noviherbaspirillum sedimenti]|uniref:6-phosphogluconate dehydrogenase NADP-binding domain-containing protein n=1 Tax=Noviherbaspirillum sedimenti TaxID=2320865 RepID=A0A3A3GQP4_9BURK|nr:NAD(P)-binding domain-containing protein [Noviherbaspirillum sedimenti]RJG03300.1 hypothetical protein D3878_18315 [Noviherbaspirillum sedimenti]